MTIDEINNLSALEFIEKLGFLYEHSRWIVEQAETKRPFADHEAVLAGMNDIVANASTDQHMSLICEHPELAGKAAIDDTLTDASKEEQASAGLDRMTPEEYALFGERNRAYQDTFGFPFIICVKLTNKDGILRAMSDRLENTKEQETKTALDEISKIVRLRYMEMVGS